MRCTGRPRPIPDGRFHALSDKVCRRDVLWRAWVAVRRNNGAPGIDKITLAGVEEYGVTRLLGELASELREGTVPAAARPAGAISRSRARTSRGRCRFRRRRHSAASSSDPLGFVIVTHPFHPLNGQRLEVLYAKRRGADTVFVCAGGCQRPDDAAAGVDRPGRAARLAGCRLKGSPRSALRHAHCRVVDRHAWQRHTLL